MADRKKGDLYGRLFVFERIQLMEIIANPSA